MKRLSLTHFSADSFNRQQETHRRGGGHGCPCACSYICECTCSNSGPGLEDDTHSLSNGPISLVKDSIHLTLYGPLPPDPYD